MSRGTKKDCENGYEEVCSTFQVIDRFIIYLILLHAWTWDRTCWWGQVEF